MLGAYHNQTGSGRVLAGDACQGRQPGPSADSLVWWEHVDGDQALGRLEVHVTGEGVGYAGVDDEPDTGGVDVCCLAHTWAWHSEGGTAPRHTAAVVVCHGGAQPRLRWEPACCCLLFGKERRGLASRPSRGDLSLRYPRLSRESCRDGPDTTKGGEALAEDREDGLRGRADTPVQLLTRKDNCYLLENDGKN